jgi:cysteine-rich repeat protein
MGPGSACRVEIPLSDGGVTPAADTSEAWAFSVSFGTAHPNGDSFNASAQGGHTLGGTSDDANPTCPEANIRRRPSMGTRYLLPSTRGGDGAKTYVRWDSAAGIPAGQRPELATAFRVHWDDATSCCAAADPGRGTCYCVSASGCIIVGFIENPRVTQASCGTPNRFSNEDNIQPDLLFAGGRGTPFHTDPDFVLPGQIPGVCRANRDVPCYAAGANTLCAGEHNPFACCTGTRSGTCTEDCSNLDADPATAGLQPDTCDLRSPGYRTQVVCGRSPNNDARSDCCGTAILVLRGTPSSGCSLLPRLAHQGETGRFFGGPGLDCAVPNFRTDHRDDADCDGQADFPDLCPFYSEWDQDLDSDGDCSGGPGQRCRGDECECGDQAGSGALSGTVELGNGVVDVSDVVGINLAIFGNRARKRLCDTNNDSLCNVSDIVGAAREIFVPDSSVCREITPRQCRYAFIPDPCCGNGIIEPGEFCDDGGFLPGDGCNDACRVEHGFTCTGQPSVCQ